MALIKLNDVDEYKSYFEEIAKTHKEILHVDEDDKHFYIVDIAEVLDGQFRSNFKPNALVLEYFESSPAGPNMDQLKEKIRGAFYVIGSPVPSEDVTAKHEALKFSHQTGKDIISKMKEDMLDGLLPGFDPRKVNIQKVGPLHEELFFFRFEFEVTISANSDFCFDETKWN